MKVLHVSEVRAGGVLTLLAHFLPEQVNRGDEVHLLSNADMPVFPGVHHHDWDLRRGRPWSYPAAVRRVREVVAGVRPDVVHVHSFFAGFVGRLPLHASVPAGVPVVYQPHAWSDQLYPWPAAAALLRTSERISARQTTLVVANCHDELFRGHGLGVHVPGRAIGVAVDLGRFRPPTEAERQAARAELGLDDRRVVLMLGRLTRQKGQDLLAAAWERRDPDDALLVLVGPGETDWIADQAPRTWRRSIRTAGAVADVVPWLWASDVMALSSRYETVALAVAEAMACGLPVVATPVDGAREVLVRGPEPPAGTVADAHDLDDVLRLAFQRLTDPAVHRFESEAGPRRAALLFSPESVVDRLDAAYRAAISATTSGSLR